MLRASVVLMLLAIAAWAVSEMRRSPFEGTWEGDGLLLTLEAKGDRFEGSARLEGLSAAVAARATSATQIQGTYSVQGVTLPFQGTLRGGKLIIEADGETLTLERRTSAAEATDGTLRDPGWGIELKAPKGWKGRRAEGLFLFGSDLHKGILLVVPNEASTVAEIKEGAKAGYAEEGIELKLEGSTRAFSTNGIAATFAGTAEGTPVKASAVGLVSPHGTGAVIVALVEASSHGTNYDAFAAELAKSIRFFKPEVPDFVSDWKSQLAGKRLEYLSSYTSSGGGGFGGTSQNETIELYANGFCTFRYRSSLSITAGAYGYSSSKDNRQGTWNVVAEGQTPILRMTFEDGSTKNYRITYKDRKLYLEGYRYFMTSMGG